MRVVGMVYRDMLCSWCRKSVFVHDDTCPQKRKEDAEYAEESAKKNRQWGEEKK
jgi:hypothetical protein